MCGIAGVFCRSGEAGEAERARVAAALGRLRHRGPDDEGMCRATGLVLGHRRLSILDLSPAGHQPMATPDDRFHCVLNGEIYNYLELRDELRARGRVFRTGTDTEVLLAAIAEWGSDAILKFRGQFAFAVWDGVERRLLLARDRVGEKPLYFVRDADRLVFASELKALLALLPRPPALEGDAIHAYLHYQFVVEPDTPLEGVRKLAAGCVLELSADGWDAAPRRYWSLAEAAPVTGDPVERLRPALEDAVALTLRSDVPVGVALSGGLDSSVIAALAARGRHDVSAFTVGYPGAPAFDERARARDLARVLDIPWASAELPARDFVTFFPRLVDMLDEPIADLAAYAHYHVARLAADHGIKVLLTGIGGDELFFGYGWVRQAVRLSAAKLAAVAAPGALRREAVLSFLMHRTPVHTLATNYRLPAAVRTRVDALFDGARLDLAHPDEWVFYQLDYQFEPASAFAAAVFAPSFAERLTPRGPYALMRRRLGGMPAEVAITQLLFDSWLVSNCLDLGDRLSMASSVETRVPLLDSRLIETAVGLWAAGRTDDAQGHKTWLRAIAREVLPPDVVNREKLGFVTPTREWIDGVNAQYAGLLEDGALAAAGVIEPDRLRRWRRDAPPGVRRDFFLYKLTLLEVWCRAVVHGQTPAPAGG